MASVPNSKAEYVAQLLLDKIVTANLEPGTSFGTEADLLQQFDVSRPTLRESLRILESQGVLELRPGPKGGIMVRRPGTDILAHGLSIYLRMHDVPFSAVLKAREAVEPALAAEAAVNGSEEDFDAMQASIDNMATIKDPAAFIEENRLFHSLVAKASGNKVMEIFWATISIVAVGEEHGVRYTPRSQKHVIEAHRQILEALRARDSDQAAERMREHVGELEMFVKKNYQHLLDQATSIVARQGRRVS
ncbi:FadR/GntR family transcriptional regulator [Antarctobacter sp.]|uniref:FadR/GntR family transcriptional regulator n=1 Tax=Antarctobacter sp. TaxID=1872577 RepID=UPI003A8D2B07